MSDSPFLQKVVLFVETLNIKHDELKIKVLDSDYTDTEHPSVLVSFKSSANEGLSPVATVFWDGKEYCEHYIEFCCHNLQDLRHAVEASDVALELRQKLNHYVQEENDDTQ